MSLDMTTFDAALKVHYTDDRVKNIVYKNNPLLAMLPKMERFGGKNLPIPIQFGVPGSRSANFANALAQKNAAFSGGINRSSRFEDYVLTRVKDYCLASIDKETLEASVGNPNAFMEAAATEIDSAINSCTRSLATALYRDGTGTIGVAGAVAAAGGGAPASITLATTDDVVNFEVGMRIQGIDAGGVVHSGNVITAVDRDLGIITVPTLGSIAAADSLFCEGDRNAKISGLAAWVPGTAPVLGDSFFGVDRSVDTSRLAGVRATSAGAGNKVESLIKASARLAREGGRPTHCFMNHTDYGMLLEELDGKVRYCEVQSYERADISFAALQLHTPSGTVTVVPDHNCPPTVCYLLQMDTWKLYSLGGAPKILQTDGLRFLRESSSDGVEVRVGYYAQLGCNAPGYNCVITGF